MNTSIITSTDTRTAIIYPANLADYNDGILRFLALPLPATEDELKKAFSFLQHGGTRDDELFISDWECIPFEISEYSSITEINDKMQKIADFTAEQQYILNILTNEVEFDFDSAVECIDECYIIDASTDEELGMALAEEYGVLDQIPEHLQGYFNYRMFGQDARLTGGYYFTGADNSEWACKCIAYPEF